MLASPNLNSPGEVAVIAYQEFSATSSAFALRTYRQKSILPNIQNEFQIPRFDVYVHKRGPGRKWGKR